MAVQIKVGLLGGTGLDQDSGLFQDLKKIVVPDTPYGSPSDSEVLEGTVSGVTCYLMGRHGRDHDKSPSNVNYRANLWTFKELGCQIVLVTTACGSLREEIEPGHFGILDQYIDR
jgi:5'-methylthioadenosine phosphorylase